VSGTVEHPPGNSARLRLIDRDDLLAALDRAAAGKIAIVTAPAGSGKSTLLRAWAGRRGRAHRLAFVQVQRDKQDAQLFWLALLNAVRRMSGDPVDAAPQAASPDFHGAELVDRILAELECQGGPVDLVIDDVHELGSPETFGDLTRLLANLPPEVHAILATRRDLPLRLHHLRLSGELAELREADLRFTLDETRALLAGSPAIDAAAGCPPPDADERGVTRPQGAACDIGAVETEVGGTTTTTTSTTTTTTTTTTIISATTTTSTTTISVTTSTTTSVTTTTTTTTTTVPGTTTTTTATTTSTINVTTTTITATTTTITGSTTTTVTGATTTTLAATTTTTLAPTEVCGNCADDDGNGLTDDEDPACCANPAAMQVKKVLIVPGPAGAMKGHLSLTAILAQTGFADVDPTRDDVAVQFHNPNGELLCATAPHERWTRERHRGPFQFEDPTGTMAQGLRKMQIKVQKNGSTRFTTAGKKMDLGRYAQPTFTTTVRVGERCSTATIALRNRGNKKFVFP